MSWIDRRYGTWRGAARLWLTRVEMALGLSGERKPEPAEVRRLVFVCHGNICRSAYADVLARKLGFNAASFGLSTEPGSRAHRPIIKAAEAMGIDLAAHRSMPVEAFRPQPGDLLLAMETRHLRKLAGIQGLGETPRLLLGRFSGWPHLHDPYEIAPDYTAPCLGRIDRAVRNAAKAYPGVDLS